MEQKTSTGINKILVILLIIAAFVIGSLWQKNQKLENSTKQASSSPQVTGQQIEQESPLSIANLKKYSQELGLNTDQFNSCLDEDKYQDQVVRDIQTAQDEFNINGTPGFLINGRKLGGAFPLETFKEIIDKELAGKATENIADYSTDLQNAAKQEAFDPKKRKFTIENDDPILGPASAQITLIEFSDFQCPYCAKAYPTVKQLIKDYSGKIRFVYKQLPLNAIHPFAQKAAEASLCAKEQDKFFEYHDKLFEVQGAQAI